MNKKLDQGCTPRGDEIIRKRIRSGAEDLAREILCSFRVYKTRISNAVVCGGILAVINAAWRTRTRKPGTSLEKCMGLPALSNINVFLATLNLMIEEFWYGY